MNKEIQNIIYQLKDAYEGDPWFGLATKEILAKVSEETAFQKPNKQHSTLELVWHMITWREFIISHLRPDAGKTLQYFEQNDWRKLDHTQLNLWHEGLQQLDKTQTNLIKILEEQNDDLLKEHVRERKYNFRKLLYGIIQHDIYHLGQIAYIKKIVADSTS
jgi:uncharacterized damage-inducible protein DinB